MTRIRSIPFGRPWITEADKKAVLGVLGGDVLTHGPQGRAFEEEFSRFMGGEGQSISVSSGMAALHLSYFQLGIQPGDQVILPALTHVATAHAVEVMGATSVFADCDPLTGNIDVTAVKKLITPKTKAIGLVHFLGIPCPMKEIMDVATAAHVKVVEDCALAVGSRYERRHVGLFGEGGCFSFYPVKHITTGEGGMFVTRHKDVADRVRQARAFGVDRSFDQRSSPGMYDVVSLGFNYRMSDLNACLGRVQLGRIEKILNRRKENFQRLKKSLSGLRNILVLDSQEEKAQSSHYCLSVVLKGPLRDQRSRMVGLLKEKGIGTSVYYPRPVPAMSYYRQKYGYKEDSHPHATEISGQSIALPVGPHLESRDIDFISENFLNVAKEVLK